MDPENNIPSAPAYAQPKSNPFIIPAAIVIGFGLIAAALFFSNGTVPAVVSDTMNDPEQVTPESGSVRPIDEEDHVLGNPNAPIVIIEYSDYDCPFCKNFHETMSRILDEYGSTGQVAWVYRHFPLEQLHPNAPGLALASECVADLGGNDAFWAFSDRIFAERDVNELTNMTQVPQYAEASGVSKEAFIQCVSDGTLIANVNEDFNEGVGIGVRGTPHSLVLVGGQQGVINGAQPYEAVKQIVETLLNQIESGTAQ